MCFFFINRNILYKMAIGINDISLFLFILFYKELNVFPPLCIQPCARHCSILKVKCTATALEECRHTQRDIQGWWYKKHNASCRGAVQALLPLWRRGRRLLYALSLTLDSAYITPVIWSPHINGFRDLLQYVTPLSKSKPGLAPERHSAFSPGIF